MKTVETEIKYELYSRSGMLNVSFPALGKTGKKAVFSVAIENDSEVERNVRKFEKKHIDSIVSGFWNNKKQRYANAFRSTGGNGHLMALQVKLERLASIINTWGVNPYFEYLNRFILPLMEELQVQSTQNQFYEYEKDLMNYLKAVCENRLKKESI